MSKRDYFSSYQSPNIVIETKEVNEDHENKKFRSEDTTRSSSNFNNNKPPITSIACNLPSIKKNKIRSSVTKIDNDGSLSGESKTGTNRTKLMYSPMKVYKERGKTNEFGISKPIMKSVVQVPVITNIKHSKENNKEQMPRSPLALGMKQMPNYENVDELKSSNVIYKEIELIIDVVYKSKTSDNEEENEIPNEDLSFLDDFNIDEIVESLNYVDKSSLKKKDTEEQQEKDISEKDNTGKYTKKDNTEKNGTSHRKDNVTINVNLQVNNVSQINNNSTNNINISKSKAPEDKADLGKANNTKEYDKEPRSFKKDVLNNDKKCVDIKYDNERIKRNKSSIDEKSTSDEDEKFIPPPGLYLSNKEMYLSGLLQKRMSKIFNRKCTLQSILYRGSMSRLMKYRAENNNGVDYYTVIVLNPAHTMHQERLKVFQQMERKTEHLAPIHYSCMLLGRWCFITDFFPNTLKSLLVKENIHIKNLQILARQLIMAMFVLREKGCIHTDCTPSNILVNSTHDRLKIFGFDKIDYFDYVHLHSDSGSVNYRPPEVIIGYPSKYKINVWSSALIMYEMATNTQLFPGTNNNEILFEQLSLLGNLPDDMLYGGDFAHDHFCKRAFMRKLGPDDMDVSYIFHFKSKVNQLHIHVLETYNTIWSHHRTYNEQIRDKSKLWQLVELIKRMLVINPSKRLSLDFVYADSFIYD